MTEEPTSRSSSPTTRPKQQIDYRHKTWGHSVVLKKTNSFLDFPDEPRPLYEGHFFYRYGVREGDEFLLDMVSGKVGVFVINDLEPCHDPSDMYFFTAYLDRYLED